MAARPRKTISEAGVYRALARHPQPCGHQSELRGSPYAVAFARAGRSGCRSGVVTQVGDWKEILY